MIADRAGVLTANAPDCTATSANSTHSCVVAQPALHGEPDGRRPGHDRRDERDPAAVVVVDDRPAVQPEDHQRDQRAEPEQTDRRRRPGDRVHLEPDRDDRQLRAEVGDRQPPPQPPERRTDAQRRGVDDERGHRTSLVARATRPVTRVRRPVDAELGRFAAELGRLQRTSSARGAPSSCEAAVIVRGCRREQPARASCRHGGVRDREVDDRPAAGRAAGPADDRGRRPAPRGQRRGHARGSGAHRRRPRSVAARDPGRDVVGGRTRPS